MIKRKKRIRIITCIVICAILFAAYHATTIKVYSDDNSWSVVFMNAENQLDGTWEGYLVYENSSKRNLLDEIYVEIDVDHHYQKDYKGTIEFQPSVPVSSFRRITFRALQKQMFCFLTFAQRPKSAQIKVIWTEDNQRKETLIRYN